MEVQKLKSKEKTAGLNLETRQEWLLTTLTIFFLYSFGVSAFIFSLPPSPPSLPSSLSNQTNSSVATPTCKLFPKSS